ncbi:MAG: tRNA (adenosine(37)-N6)-threonylcarbamoyltransferase complex dimerization subunit type 1 TsaB [Chloroflexi bacterium]|nr:tRNA (adenosine(37)-N6)-threonylcarbamoyltransferase complex dimerization subunit type 1 TsaB [Chloroflexota bacterium]
MSAVLAIDTASSAFALAIAIDGVCASSVSADAAQDHSRLLLPAIDRLLHAHRDELAGIVAVRGPGSYAGLRVGLATAEGLALARGIPLRGIGTLEAVAAAVDCGDLTVIHPAGRGEFAAQDVRNGALQGMPWIARPEELAGPIAGEGAGALGSCEVTAEERCRAALRLGIALLGEAGGGDSEAFYLREPNITRPRRAAVHASGRANPGG